MTAWCKLNRKRSSLGTAIAHASKRASLQAWYRRFLPPAALAILAVPVLGSASVCCAQAFNQISKSAPSQAPGQAPSPVAPVPRQVVSDAIANEIKLIQYGDSYLRYQVHTQDSKGDQVREVIESKDGTVARLLKRGDRPLTPQEDADEHARLEEMLNSPEAFQKHIQKDQAGKKLAVDLIKLLPEAMIYTYAQGQPQRPDSPTTGPHELVIDFKPDPHWNPPGMFSEALTGLEGRCWIDARTHHLTRLEADLFQGVNFGLGIFAHLYPGGTFVLEQVPAPDGRWIVRQFTEHVKVRAMMVKTMQENTQLVASDFAAIPAMNYQQAIKQLLDAK